MPPLPLATPLLFVVIVVTTTKNEHASPQSWTTYVKFGSAFLRWIRCSRCCLCGDSW